MPRVESALSDCSYTALPRLGPWPPRPISWHFVPRRTGCFARAGTPTLGPVEAAPPRPCAGWNGRCWRAPADIRTLAGVAAERRDPERLRREGRLDAAALRARTRST